MIEEEGEEWRPIEGWEGYEVSNKGRVRSYRVKGDHSGKLLSKPHLLKLQNNGNGYVFVYLSVNGTTKKHLVHRLVASIFIPGEGQEVAHWNSIRDDNRVENLRWASVSDNQKDRIRHGTYGSKFSESTIRAVLDLYVPGLTTQKDVAKYLGISPTHVSRIFRRETWSHLE